MSSPVAGAVTTMLEIILGHGRLGTLHNKGVKFEWKKLFNGYYAGQHGKCNNSGTVLNFLHPDFEKKTVPCT